MENKKRTILVVDDEPSITMLIEDFLSLRGYNVFCAFDGNEGLSLFKDKKPDIVILDMKMPGIQGDRLKKLIKEIDDTVQIILTSGHLEVEDLCNNPNDFFLKKPFNIRDLINVVKEAEKRLMK